MSGLFDGFSFKDRNMYLMRAFYEIGDQVQVQLLNNPKPVQAIVVRVYNRNNDYNRSFWCRPQVPEELIDRSGAMTDEEDICKQCPDADIDICKAPAQPAPVSATGWPFVNPQYCFKNVYRPGSQVSVGGKDLTVASVDVDARTCTMKTGETVSFGDLRPPTRFASDTSGDGSALHAMVLKDHCYLVRLLEDGPTGYVRGQEVHALENRRWPADSARIAGALAAKARQGVGELRKLGAAFTVQNKETAFARGARAGWGLHVFESGDLTADPTVHSIAELSASSFAARPPLPPSLGPQALLHFFPSCFVGQINQTDAFEACSKAEAARSFGNLVVRPAARAGLSPAMDDDVRNRYVQEADVKNNNTNACTGHVKDDVGRLNMRKMKRHMSSDGVAEQTISQNVYIVYSTLTQDRRSESGALIQNLSLENTAALVKIIDAFKTRMQQRDQELVAAKRVAADATPLNIVDFHNDLGPDINKEAWVPEAVQMLDEVYKLLRQSDQYGFGAGSLDKRKFTPNIWDDATGFKPEACKRFQPFRLLAYANSTARCLYVDKLLQQFGPLSVRFAVEYGGTLSPFWSADDAHAVEFCVYVLAWAVNRLAEEHRRHPARGTLAAMYESKETSNPRPGICCAAAGSPPVRPVSCLLMPESVRLSSGGCESNGKPSRCDADKDDNSCEAQIRKVMSMSPERMRVLMKDAAGCSADNAEEMIQKASTFKAKMEAGPFGAAANAAMGGSSNEQSQKSRQINSGCFNALMQSATNTQANNNQSCLVKNINSCAETVTKMEQKNQFTFNDQKHCGSPVPRVDIIGDFNINMSNKFVGSQQYKSNTVDALSSAVTNSMSAQAAAAAESQREASRSGIGAFPPTQQTSISMSEATNTFCNRTRNARSQNTNLKNMVSRGVAQSNTANICYSGTIGGSVNVDFMNALSDSFMVTNGVTATMATMDSNTVETLMSATAKNSDKKSSVVPPLEVPDVDLGGNNMIGLIIGAVVLVLIILLVVGYFVIRKFVPNFSIPFFSS